MKVLALASYPIEAAATRYRLEQFVAPLAERGIDLTIRPFLDSQLFSTLYRRDKWVQTAIGLLGSAFGRLADILSARRFDVLLVQREAMLFGPPVVEMLSMLWGRCPLVLDLDDATYVSYTSPTYGRFASWLKCFWKTDSLINRSTLVTCGNSTIANYVEGKGKNAEIIPTVVDTDRFCPRSVEPDSSVPVLGWVGTHSTFPYLESIFPALAELARKWKFKLRVVGAGREEINLPGVVVENFKWSLEREIADFQSFDIGLYPIIADEWSAGKSGFKAIQYMAIGIPFVSTPIAASGEIGVPGKTHLAAFTLDEWRSALERLLSDREARRRMGRAGRLHALEFYNVPLQADKLANALRSAVSARGRSMAVSGSAKCAPD
jgi:glycosyltransferase involved in cell wall biosynthesis